MTQQQAPTEELTPKQQIAALTQQVEVLQKDSAHYAGLLANLSEALERLEHQVESLRNQVFQLGTDLVQLSSTLGGIQTRTTEEALRVTIGQTLREFLENSKQLQALVATVMQEHQTHWGSYH